ncbi:MAG: LysE family translocator [Actinomycetota bacterium]|nr:LysE family translocator [Actinomycetota bacterium]
MFQGTSLILFLTASLALIVTPGPDMIYVVTRGVAQGRAAGLVSVWGACSGLIVHTMLASVGLSALLRSSATAFMVVKYAGAVYLISLGIKAFLGRENFSVAREPAPTLKLGKVFFQGLASNLLNPKIALFFLAFLPQFVSLASGNAALHMLILGLVFTTLALLVFNVIAYYSGALGNWLGKKPGFANDLRWLTGSVLVGLGLRLALPEKA